MSRRAEDRTSDSRPVRERPIDFDASAVEAILDGRKTRTHRPVLPQPVLYFDQWEWRPPGSTYDADFGRYVPSVAWMAGRDPLRTGAASIVEYCPFLAPGDRLWVREPFLAMRLDGRDARPAKPGEEPDYVCFRDGSQVHSNGAGYDSPTGKILDPSKWPPNAVWRHSTAMPRWAARVHLRIVAVDVERLLDAFDVDPAPVRDDWNPWVWVVSFERTRARTEGGRG